MSDYYKRITGLVRKDLEISNKDPFPEETSNPEELKQKLTQLVSELLDRDFNRLLNALYRMDVDEEKLKKALSDYRSPPAPLIADLIIERQKQKLLSRMSYRSKR